MKEVKSIIALILLAAFSFATYFGVTYLGEQINKAPIVWLYVVIYIVIAFIFERISIKFPNKFFIILSKIISIPIGIPLVIIDVAFPMATMLMAAFLYFGLSIMLPGAAIFILKRIQGLDLNSEVYTLIMWSATSIIAVLFYDMLFRTTNKLMRFDTSKKLKKAKLPQLLEYSLQKENIRMIIYGWFFIFLSIYSFELINGWLKESQQIHNKAILNSFLIFLAFDRMLIYSKQVNFRPSRLLDKIGSSIKRKL